MLGQIVFAVRYKGKYLNLDKEFRRVRSFHHASFFESQQKAWDTVIQVVPESMMLDECGSFRRDWFTITFVNADSLGQE